MPQGTVKKGIQLFGVFVLFLVLSFSVLSQTRVQAANLSSLSDTLTSSKTGTASNHTITFRSATGVSSGTIVVNLTNVVSSIGSVDYTDIDLQSGGTDRSLGAIAAANTWGVSVAGGGLITFSYPTSCSSPCSAISSGATVTILVGTNASGGNAQMTNVSTTGSKYVSIAAGSDVGLFAVSLQSNASMNAGGTADIPASTSSVSSPAPAPAPTPTPAPTTTTTTESPTQTTTTETAPPAETAPTPTPAPTTTTTTESPTQTTTTEKTPAPTPTTSTEKTSSTETPSAPAPVQTPPSPAPEINVPTPQPEIITIPSLSEVGGVTSPYVLGVSNAVGGGGAQALLQAGSFVAPDGRSVSADVQLTPMSFLQSLDWTGCTSTLKDISVIGNTAYNFSAQNNTPKDAGDFSVDSNAPVALTISYGETDVVNQGIIEGTIHAIAFDPGDCNQSVRSTLNEVNKTVTIVTLPKTFFALTGDVREGFTQVSKLELPTFEITPVYSDISLEDLNLKDVDKNDELALSGNTFVATENSTIDLCLASKLFKKPVKKIILSISSLKYTLTYNKNGDCFGAKIKIPAQGGEQDVELKVIYVDDQVQIIKIRMILTSQFQANLLKYALPFLDQIQALNEQVGKTVEQNQPIIQTTAAVAVPIVGVANPSLVTNALNWYYYINHFLSWLLSLLGIRKKRKPWGVVYNSITKTAIDLVIVRLFEKASNRLIETQVTDKSGRFSFLAPPGEYYITATKNPLVFPSHIVKGSIDGDYSHIYRQESFSIATPDQAMTLSVPLDPPAFDHAHAAQRFHLVKWWKTFVGKNPLAPLLVGFIISEVLVLYIPNTVNYTLLWFNGFFLVTQMALGLKSEKEWGLVFDAVSLAPVPLAAITIFDAQEGKMLRTRLTDYFGRFSFLTPTGKYLLAVNKEGYQFPVPKDMHIAKYHHLYYGDSFDVKGKRALVKTNIPVVLKSPEPATAREAVALQSGGTENTQGQEVIHSEQNAPQQGATPPVVEQPQLPPSMQEKPESIQRLAQSSGETPPLAQSERPPSE